MPTITVVATVPAQDLPGPKFAQILRELAMTLEGAQQYPPQASWTHLDRVLRTSRATWTIA